MKGDFDVLLEVLPRKDYTITMLRRINTTCSRRHKGGVLVGTVGGLLGIDRLLPLQL